jgi:DNA replication protein DnaC
MNMNNLSMVKSYIFWNWWFSQKLPALKKIEGYTWPEPLASYNNMLKGRPCPFCQSSQLFSLQTPTILDDITIDGGYCICLLLNEMERTYQFESDYHPETLMNFEELTAEAKQIKTEVRHFAHRPSSWYYLYGGYGSGKTHLLSAIKKRLRGLALYITATDLNGLVFTATAEHKLDDLLSEIIDAPVLLLDDLGTEHASDYLYTAIYTIINTRYIKRNLAPVFVTSNLSQAQLMASSNENMRRVGSRLNDRQLVIPLVSTQSDYRMEEHNAH